MSDHEPEAWLWDRTGPVDPTVHALESLLGRFAHDGRARSVRPRFLRRRLIAALAALVLIAVGVVWLRSGRSIADPGHGFIVARSTDPAVPVPDGTWLEPAGRSEQLRIGDLGVVEIEPGSRVRIDASARHQTRLFLAEGRLAAKIDPAAGARFFQVATPGLNCVDLGCQYVLEYDAASGETEVRVTHGRVAFESGAGAVFVPAGAGCTAPRNGVLGTPCYLDANPAFRKLAYGFDRIDVDALERRDWAGKLCGMELRERDSLTLWHLLFDVDPEVVRSAEQALVRLTGVPKEAKAQKTFEGIDPRVWRAHLERYW